MTLLVEYWKEFKRIEILGERTSRAKEIEGLIHSEQKRIGSPPYDFDERWMRNNTMGKSTLSGPPPPDAKPDEEVPDVPKFNFSFEDAKKIVGDNDYNILEDCAKWAEARMVCLARILDRLNADNSNVARRGQATNIAIGEFLRRKLNG